MRSAQPRYWGVLAPRELDRILGECRQGEFQNAHWLVKYFSQDDVPYLESPEDCGTSWDELNRWCRAAAAEAAARDDAN
jgi:hypothetical protein